MRPKISICIPVYNGLRYLAQTLDSACGQRGDDIEILISDDGSTDGSLDLIRKYAQADSRIRICESSVNRGLVGNWNFCISEARGEWIKFLFQDDVLYPNYFEYVRPYLNGDIAFVITQRRIQIEPGMSEDFARNYQNLISTANLVSTRRTLTAEDFAWVAINFLAYNFIGEPSNTMFRRSVVEKIGYFHQDMKQIVDLEFWLRIGCRFGALIIPEELSMFRAHASSTSLKNAYLNDFKTHGIDCLILMHDICYAPHFYLMRQMAMRRGLDLLSMLNSYIHLVEEKVLVLEKSGVEEPVLVENAYIPWLILCSKYPLLWKHIQQVKPQRAQHLLKYNAEIIL